MTELPDNPTAFPVSTIDGFTTPGMTLRDWFAGQALASVVSLTLAKAKDEGWSGSDTRSGIAQGAYMIADSMLSAREVHHG